MHIEVPGCRVRMIDSINFLPSALSELPKMFGLEELKKGYFPHLFNRKENQSVILNHLPDVHYYLLDAMKLIDRRNRLTSFSILNVPKMTGSSVNKDSNRMTTKNVFFANHRGVELSNINLIYV